uniref:Uncharacterized protein n=1 Tax=Oryza glaberrima TaxID=4538 RepID=I1PFB0_ORYGL
TAVRPAAATGAAGHLGGQTGDSSPVRPAASTRSDRQINLEVSHRLGWSHILPPIEILSPNNAPPKIELNPRTKTKVPMIGNGREDARSMVQSDQANHH